MQGLYQWQLTGDSAETIEGHLRERKTFPKLDEDHFKALLHGVPARAEELEAVIRPYLDRPLKELSPVEHNILLMGAYELAGFPEIPYRVVINEAVELAKAYGGTDGHKYVNGVLDKLATKLRPSETKANLEPQSPQRSQSKSN